jgi:hypothetical protein
MRSNPNNTVTSLSLHFEQFPLNLAHMDKELAMDKLLEFFYGALFDWSRVWGFTSTSSVGEFVVSLAFENSVMPL